MGPKNTDARALTEKGYHFQDTSDSFPGLLLEFPPRISNST